MMTTTTASTSSLGSGDAASVAQAIRACATVIAVPLWILAIGVWVLAIVSALPLVRTSTSASSFAPDPVPVNVTGSMNVTDAFGDEDSVGDTVAVSFVDFVLTLVRKWWTPR